MLNIKEPELLSFSKIVIKWGSIIFCFYKVGSQKVLLLDSLITFKLKLSNGIVKDFIWYSIVVVYVIELHDILQVK
jgi:hypothetical protein